jgi:hypothetical protein
MVAGGVTDIDRTFEVASDDKLVELIGRARRRLVFICPALRESVACALANRLNDGFAGATIILDADPEVYRLGYGTEVAFDLLRAACNQNFIDLRVQQGVRIGIVISDDITMVFSPVPLLIEAGSNSAEKPNALIISGETIERLAKAAGAGAAEEDRQQEIGTEALTPQKATTMKDDLKANPPQPFDISRALRVFNSKVQYVEIQVENYRFSSRQIQLPTELLDIADAQLRHQLSTRLRLPAEALGPFELTIETKDGTALAIKADEKWIASERKSIEDEYTFPVPRYGRVIFTRDRAEFDREIERFKRNLEKYGAAVRATFEGIKEGFEKRLIDEFLPRWRQKPPSIFAKHGVSVTEEILKQEMDSIVKEIAEKAISFDPPEVRIVYKSVSPESVQQRDFLAPLREVMRRRRVPRTVIESLFSTGEAAPATAGTTPTR